MSMSKLIRSALLAGACVIATLGSANAQEFQTPVDANFNEGDIRFTGELGTVYTFMWDARAVDGRIAICGVGYLRDSRLRGTIRDMARAGLVLNLAGAVVISVVLYVLLS